MPDPAYPADPYAPAVAPRRWRGLLLAALVAFIGGAALVTWALTRWEPARRLIVPPQAPADPQAVAASGSAPVAVAGPSPGAPVAMPEPAAITESRVAGLETRIAAIDVRAAAAAANAARAEGLLVAFAARRAIDQGLPLGYLEGQLRARFGDTQPRAVAAIIAAGQRPVTVENLRQQLDVLEPGLVGGGASQRWDEAARRTISTLFVVRRANEPSPVADARLLRAHRALEGGQVAVALNEVARLPAAAVATDWMAAAGRWVDAHRALDIVETVAVTTPIAGPITGSATPAATPLPTTPALAPVAPARPERVTP